MENEREQAVHFLEDNERECTALMEQIIQDAENVFVIEKTDENIFCAFFFFNVLEEARFID